MIDWGDDKESDDLTASEGSYILRVEQMDKGRWWWRVYYKNDEIADAYTTGPNASSKKQAKLLCELAMILHKMWKG